MVGRRALPGWPDGFPGRVPIVSDVTAALGIDPFVMLLRSTAVVALATLRGRESTVTAGDVRIRGILEELTVEPDPRGVLGRLGQVRMVARDVTWAATRLRRVTLSGRNVHVRRAAISATVVAAPVLIDVEVAAEDLPPIRPRLRLAIDADGLATVHPAGAARIGLDVTPHHAADGPAVPARALRLGARRIPLPAWGLLHRRIPTDRLPAGAHLIGVRTADGVVRISAVLDEWRASVTAGTLVDLAARLTAGSTEVELPLEER
jgi:hypothetical protein